MRSPNSRAELRAALRAHPRISRDESGVEGAFGKDGTEMVRQPEGDKERVGDGPGAEQRSQHDVADEAGQPRDKRKAADGENPIDHAAFIACFAKPGSGIGAL